MEYLGWLIAGLVIGGGITYLVIKFGKFSGKDQEPVAVLLKSHFHPIKTDDITISEREFPFRVRADLQRGIEQVFEGDTKVVHFCGVCKELSHEGVSLKDCLIKSERYPTISIPPEYEEIDIGDETPVRVLKVGLWLLEQNDVRFAVLLRPVGQYGQITGLQFQIGAPNSPQGTQVAQNLFRQLEDAISKADSYRGKVLSLEQAEHSYTGKSTGITVHNLRLVERDDVVLPETTLRLLERNIIQFVRQRDQLAKYKQATKKGVLFYGPPGTGKTHTIHYLSRALEDHTTLLISADQVAMLAEYMTLARLLQPSIVVLEDVDLIARDRARMKSACDEILLNKLLNEMDGLKPEADILFVLTTNRPEALESALASRPGRIDQAIEFPPPDETGRGKLIRLYSEGISLSDEVVADVVRRTEGVSAAFIKELMRRSVQFHIERKGTGEINNDDVAKALDEMLVSGGSLNLKLLGAGAKIGYC